MNEAINSQIRVESLNARHLTALALNAQTSLIPRLQLMLLRSWISKAEKKLPALLPSRQPYCLVAKENSKLNAYIIVYPFNRRGNCWSLSLPTLLNTNKSTSKLSLTRELFHAALEYENTRAQSWIIKCPSNRSEEISVSRELGFQPLKSYKCWKPNSDLIRRINCEIILPKNFLWQRINKRNAQLIWNIEKANESSHLRQILDRQCYDLLDNNSKGSGILITKSQDKEIAIAGLISKYEFNNELNLEILRDSAWDSRLTSTLPVVLENLISNNEDLTLETSNEDDNLSNLLIDNGWEYSGDKILLGKSLWRRQTKRNSVSIHKPLESMLGRLQPQRPPLPNPSLHPR